MAGAGKPYSDPYLTGIGLGLVLLAAYVCVGRGLGASGAFSSVVAAAATGSASPLGDWLVLELVGVAAGGGVLMGLGAKFARGCTSGQALSGGALLSAGSWIFIAVCFATGYLLAPLARRLWR